MNPFRIVILVLLTLAIVFMFVVTMYLVPNLRENAEMSRNHALLVNMNQREKSNEAYQNSISTALGETELTQALEEQRKAEEELRMQLAEQEERKLVEQSRKREDEALRREREKQAQEAAQTYGTVTSYLPEWGSLTFSPAPGIKLEVGTRAAIQQNERIIGEIRIDEFDQEGQYYSAELLPNQLGASAEQFTPAAGDTVIKTPFASTIPDAAPSIFPSIETASPMAPATGAQLPAELLYDQDIPTEAVPLNITN